MEKLDPKGIENILALTPLQEGMLFHYLQDPQSGHYFEQLSLEISGTINIQIFAKAWDVVIQTNEMLRTVFRWEKLEKPSQIILKEHQCQVSLCDLSAKDGGQKKTALEEIKTKDRDEGFDFNQVPFRVILCKLDETKYEMIISNHHILYDGWSNGIILKEFFKAYHELCEGGQLQKPPVKPPFKEFIIWLQNQDKNKQERFWSDYLAGFETPTELPIKRKQRKQEERTGAEDYSIILEEDMKVKLDIFIKNNKVTLASVFYTAWGTLLQKYCDSDDVIFGTTVSGRSNGIKGIEEIVGLFINTIPLRTQTTPSEKIIDVVFQIDQILREREEFENTPLVDIGTYSSVGGGGSLFDTIVVIENYPLGDVVRRDVARNVSTVHSYSIIETTHYDLSVCIMPSNEIEIKFSFNRELFEKETIENLAGHFNGIIQNMIENPETALSQLEIITSEEKNRVLYEFNNTAAQYPTDKTIHQLFVEQAEKTPDHIALVGADSQICPNPTPNPNPNTNTFSYRQLNDLSGRLAGLLIEKGVLPDNIVGIMMERSVEMIIGILGILNSGGAYLPIAPNYPQERIDYMLKDSAVKILINKSEARNPKFETNSNDQKINDQNKNRNFGISSNLAYIIYTSGSTGKPKGVMIEHRSAVNLLYGVQHRYPFTGADVYLLKTSYTFDVSVTELFGWYMGGGRLVILAKDGEKDPRVILDSIERNCVSHINFVPSMFNAFLDFVTKENKGRLGSLKYIFLAGEALLSSQVKKFRDLHTAIILENIYGPTEGTVYSSNYSLSDWNGNGNVPIGKPLANIELYILNKYNHLQPLGIPGELVIGGSGLAQGYLNNPELTAAKFKHDLWDYRDNHDEKNKRLAGFIYKTGDLARWLPDGNIEFIGRIDHQVKIRGFRVELGEIESLLLQHRSIKDTVVVLKEDETGDKYLAAYFVSDRELPDAELREYLLKGLPDYMIPSYFTRLEKMPLTPSGKVDRKALPEPQFKAQEVYAAPRDEMEKKLAEIWGRVLAKDISLNPIGIDDNFFRLGGHSLKATSLAALIHKTFNVKLPLGEIFKRPTIRQLSDYINIAVNEQYVFIEPVEEKEYYRLSSAQKRLYFLQQMDNAGTVYNMPSVWILEGELDKSHLGKVFNKLIKQHESLRTSFIMADEEPVQQIHDEVAFEIEYKDLATEDTEVTEVIHHFVRAFNLSGAPLLRVGLLKEKGDRHFLLVDMHHIISDGSSQNVLVKDFTALYQGEDLPELQLQYKDFARWQNHETQKEFLKPQEDYWLNQLAGEIPVLELPFDYPRPPVQSFAGNSIHFEIERATTGVLNRLALETNTTLYMILLAVYNIFLAKITNQEDIVVGSPIAGRRHVELEKIIGMFVNTLALRNYPSGEKTFTGFLHEVKEKTVSAFENQDYQFEDLVERVKTNRDTSRNPVFDVMFVLQNMGLPEIELPGLVLKPYDYENKTAKFDLNLTGLEKNGKLVFILEYSTRLFKEETAQRLSNYFKNLIDAVSENPAARISTIEIMSKAEKKRILEISNGITEPVDRGETIHGMFEKITIGNEAKTALVFRDGRMTYGELNRRANRLAWMLRNKGIVKDSVVGLMAERSFELVIGMVGIMKAGGAFLPIDPKLPGQRKSMMVEDSHMPALVTNFEIAREIPGNIEIIDLRKESIYKYKEEENSGDIININQGSDLAYVIFTSGSTGRPKGVMLEHTNLVNLIRFHHKYTGIACSKVMQFATISFDASFHEIFSALLAGGELYLMDEETRNNIPLLLEYIEKNKIKTLFLPMAFLKIIFNDDDYLNTFPRSVEHIQTAGEQVVVSEKFKNYLKENHIYLHNHYGPSETHVITTFTMNPREDIPEFPSIGKPIQNTGIYILDKAKQLLPIGVAGELYAGGLQVGRGYLGRKEETEKKFLADNYHLGWKMYRTGDLARWCADGNIEFLGRIDQQVKIRGIRVEPGEIESQLKKIELIKDALVVVKQDSKGEKYLCAYIVLSAGPGYNDSELRNILSVNLPDYMIPAYFVQMAKMPLSPSGKIDRSALPEPELKSGESYLAPRNEIEKKLVEIWTEVLGQDVLHASQLPTAIGIDDNFFQLGGNSLKAIILVSKIHKVFEVKIPLSEIFKHPRIGELAGYIRNGVQWKYEQLELAEKKEYYTLSSAQKRLYFLQQMDKDGTAYNLSSIMILEGFVDEDKFEGAITKLIRRHESFRTSFVIIGEKPVQRIADEVGYIGHIGHKSFAELFQKRPLGEPPKAMLTSFIRPFELSCAPLLRVGLGKLAEEKYIFLVDMHHIISDGVSIQVLMQDFSAFYAGLEWSEIKRQYKDYAEWQNRERVSKKILEQQEYWQKEYAEEIPVLELPGDYARPAVQAFAGSSICFELSSEMLGALKALALETEATLYMVLLALYTILLSKLSNQEDIVVGTPVAGRRHADLEKIIGMFVNTLALRNYPFGEKKLLDFFGEVKAIALNGFENQEYQYEDLVEQIVADRYVSRNPLFDTMFVLQNTGSQKTELPLPGLKMIPYEYQTKTSKFDLTLTAVEEADKLQLTFEYSTKLFRAESIERFIVYFKNIVKSVIKNIAQRISGLEIITEAEKKRILYEFNDTERDYPRDKTIHGLFAEQVKRTADYIAVFGHGRTRTDTGNNVGAAPRVCPLSLTYRELNDRSDRLAYLLIEKGVQPDTIAAIMVERSIEMIIGILGILKAGGAYLPIDPEYPRERINYMLRDSGAEILISESEIQNSTLENPRQGISNFELRASNLIPANLAYVIYTSGTTGRPKGAMIEHQNVVRLMFNEKFQFDFNNRDIWTMFHSYCFDFSVWEMYGALLYGGKLLIIDKMTARDTWSYLKILKEEGVTVLNQTPSAFYNLANLELNSPGFELSTIYVIFGGEALTPSRLKGWKSKYPATKFINMYGITETTVHVTFKEIGEVEIESKASNIGKPIPTLNAYIVDKNLELLPIGIAGELIVGGKGVGRGYLNRPELTAEKFISVPAVPALSPVAKNIYKTGDLCKWLPDGNIEYLGRIDHQVKIRGFRIELGEIVNRILTHGQVKDAEAIVKENPQGDKCICVYFVLREKIDISDLKEYLSKELPAYMVPAYFVELEKMPLNLNGKIDRKSLPDPQLIYREDQTLPRNLIEKKLAQMWQEILAIENIGINLSFFKLGGNSLNLITLLSFIHRDFGVRPTLSEIFQNDTIEKQAELLKFSHAVAFTTIDPAPAKDYYVVSSVQRRLFFLQSLDPRNMSYNLPFVAILEGKYNRGKMEAAFRDMMARHESLRTSFHLIDEEVKQKVHESSTVNFEIEYYNLSTDYTDNTSGKTETEMGAIINSFIRPFDLSQIPFFRVGIIFIHDHRSIFMMDTHHIISDGVSQGIYMREFMALYNGEKLPPLRIQHKDFAEWLNTEEQKLCIQQQEEYWLKRFEGDIPLLSLPIDYERPSTQTFEGDVLTFAMGESLTASLNAIAAKEGATLYMALVAVFNLVLSRLSGQDDIIIGTSLAGRRHADLEGIIGMFVNALALRNYPHGDKQFQVFFQEVKQNTMEAFENQDYQFENLVDKVLTERVPGRNPLFDVMMVLNNEEYPEMAIPGLKLSKYPYEQKVAQMDLKLRMIEIDANLQCVLEYSTKLFKEETIRRLCNYLITAVANALADPLKKLAYIDILPPDEKQRLLVDFNDTEQAYPVEIPIHRLFEAQVEQTPDHIAIIFNPDEREGGYFKSSSAITYKELNRHSNCLARLLYKKGIGKENVVGIMMEPSIDMIAGLIAILKVGGAYLPIDVILPAVRTLFMLDDAQSNMLLTTGNALQSASVSFTALRGFELKKDIEIVKTPARSHIHQFDSLPVPDRSVIDLSRYKHKIGMASIPGCMSLQATRGCPYECLFCHKVWSKKHVFRSAENIFNEVEFYYQQGVRNFAIIDDCFNLNKENSSRFFLLLIKNQLNLQLFFPNGLRGDLLTPDYIDLMVEAGTRGINLSLETASPRLQKLIKKNLDIDKFKRMMDYIAAKHPGVILEIATMHGFPTETEEEAIMTLDFIKSIKWIHFPYIHILKIYPNTEMEAMALEHGISKEDILASKELAFHQLPETLPFSKRFTREYQANFMNNYFLSRERLKLVMPVQLRVMGETAVVQKYDTYLPVDIKSFHDIIDFAKLQDFDPVGEGTKIQETPKCGTIFDREPQYPEESPSAKRILLLDLSQHFSSRSMLYNVVEQPLGLMSLLTYLRQEFGGRITGRIYKAGIDFDSYSELHALIDGYKPDLVGIRTLTFYKEFFHETVSLLRQWGLTSPIIAGGPYAASDYDTILKDSNIDLVVLGEGEYTFKEVILAMLDNGFTIPSGDALQGICGIAFPKRENTVSSSRTVLLLDHLGGVVEREDSENLDLEILGDNLAYVMYTSGSTGTPKGVMVEHRHANNCIWWMQETFGLTGTEAIVQRTNLSFDPSVWEIFWPLSQGGKVKLLNSFQRKDAEYLAQLMANPGDAAIMYCPATLVSALTYLLNNKTEKPVLILPWLIIGAEPISMETVKNFFEYYNGKIVNTYGPTECTINNTYYQLEPGDPRPIVPIGRPVVNNKIYILSPHLRPTPLKVAGEICIAGNGVARGYIHNEKRTAESFIPNPFGLGKLYKTGDIGRWLDDGVIEIMGRVDEQVKLRGHRIELGEIEVALSSHSAIEKCLIIAGDNKKSRQDIRCCKKCGIGSHYPGVHIDDDGICEICENLGRYKRFFDMYFRNLEDLQQTVRQLNNRVDYEERAPYDCLLLYSGGRGSAYALYQLVDMGFKILTVTYDNGYFSKNDLENIKQITDSLGVDHVILTNSNSDRILKESVETAHTVCRGCFHTSGALAVEYADTHRIPVVIGATLSRGQIIENKLFMFADQGITHVKQLEDEVTRVQHSALDIDKKIFELIGIDIVNDRSVYEKIRTLDFYRYCDVTNREMIEYLNKRDSYWKTRKNHAIYSTNCPIKQIGDFGHLKNAGFHYYGSATSWERRLGHITLENLREDLHCQVTDSGYKKFLHRLGAVPKELAQRDEKYLAAYYVSDIEMEPADLRVYLSGKLPSYMIPAYFIPLKEIPLTSSGKVDKKKLPAPSFQVSGGRPYVKPETQEQETLAIVWSEVLGVPVERIGLDENFFELGGDSIKAIQITARLQKYQLKLEISQLFLNPNIRDMSRCVRTDRCVTAEVPDQTGSGFDAVDIDQEELASIYTELES